jgi:hypothetical protein
MPTIYYFASSNVKQDGRTEKMCILGNRHKKSPELYQGLW